MIRRFARFLSDCSGTACRHAFRARPLAVFLPALILSMQFANAAHVAADCFDDFSELGKVSWTTRLFEHIHQRWEDPVKHQLVVRSDGARLTIGSITIEDPKFLRLLGRAVARGEIAEIEAGRLIGPKALNFLTHIEALAPKDRAMKLTGSISPKSILRTRQLQIEQTRNMSSGARIDPASVWTDREIQQFDRAVEKLKISEACLQLWKKSDLRECPNMKFEFVAGDIEHISWSRAK